MRVAIDIGPIRPPRTGIGNYSFFLLDAMVRTSPETEFIGYWAGEKTVDLETLAPHIHQRRYPLPTRVLYALWERVGSPKMDRWLGGADVVHGTNYALPPVSKAKRVLTIHDLAMVVAPELCPPNVVRPFVRRLTRMAQEADRVIAVSEATARDTAEYLGVPAERISVTLEAPDPAMRPLPREFAASLLRREYGIEGPFFLSVGTIEPRKNLGQFIEALASLKETIPHRAVVVGQDGWRAEEVWELAYRLGVSDRIIRPGYINRENLAAFYSAADAFVFPSRYEGFGIPLVEAMACGCPIVATDTTSIPEVTGDAAALVPLDDAEALAKALRRVATDPRKREGLAQRGLDRVAQFTWQTCAEQTLAVYRDVCTT